MKKSKNIIHLGLRRLPIDYFTLTANQKQVDVVDESRERRRDRRATVLVTIEGEYCKNKIIIFLRPMISVSKILLL